MSKLIRVVYEGKSYEATKPSEVIDQAFRNGLSIEEGQKLMAFIVDCNTEWQHYYHLVLPEFRR